ncbi:YdeI/OmpD-associated family protein [candidate division WOR-3 bacterium]|nr:YdeI/OmpD-associated family protein [candidate division WOR-3 bacterium]
MKELEQIYFPDKIAFLNWLKKYYDNSPGVWIIFYKKHTNMECIEYRDALETALCWGWIDSIVKRIDEEKYVRKFTPRTNTANWSSVNKKMVASLIDRGEMTEAGLRKIESFIKGGKVILKSKKTSEKPRNEFSAPVFVVEEFKKNQPALENFTKLAPTYQRNFIYWITSAKKEDTRRKRLKESVQLLKENKKLGLK